MSSDGFDEAAWRRELTAHRDRKDEFFATDRQSPLPTAERESFDGLAYFEPDPDYRVHAAVEPLGGGDTVAMDTTVDTEVEYERDVRLRFDLAGEPRTLVAYRQVDGEDGGLFVPFRDKTTGQETYGAGRYMEFTVDGDVRDAERVPLDFNLAYHPFCAYNDAFACPLPPEENWLDVPVRAGERLPEA